MENRTYRHKLTGETVTGWTAGRTLVLCLYGEPRVMSYSDKSYWTAV